MCRTAKHGSTSWANNFVKIYLKSRRTEKTQMFLRRLEGRSYSGGEKLAVVEQLEERGHGYTAFFVCRCVGVGEVFR